MPPYKIIKQNGSRTSFFGSNRWLKLRTRKSDGEKYFLIHGDERCFLHTFKPIPEDLFNQGFLEFDAIFSGPSRESGIVIKKETNAHGHDRVKAFTFQRL